MKHALVALAAASLAFPVLAQEAMPTEEVMSCGQFATMTADEQMTAMSDLEPQPGEQAGDEHTATPAAADAVLEICAAHPEMELADAVEQAAEQ
jgi:hypothetical protein